MATMITPRLVVRDPDRAIAFYRSSLDADLVARFELDDGMVTHAELRVDGASFSITAEVVEWGLLSPESLPTHVCLIGIPEPSSERSQWCRIGGSQGTEQGRRPPPPCPHRIWCHGERHHLDRRTLVSRDR